MRTDVPRNVCVVGVVAASVVAGLGLAAGIVIQSGLYNVAADAPHSRLVLAVLVQIRDRSIARQSRDVKVPNLEDPAMVAEGAEHYAAMCSECHLAPGITDSEIRPGLYPKPPNLAASGVDNPKEAFWVIKHGIKMSGMPAWGRTHDDAAIWNIVAFLRRMPSLSPEAYRALASPAAEDAAGSDGDADDRDHTDEKHSVSTAPRPPKA